MKVDKALFLALATSLSAVACASPAEDEATGDGQGAASADSPYCWEPAVESVGTPAAKDFATDIGFDAATDYPAAESFCIRFGYETSDELASMDVKGSLYLKCERYARYFVPYTTYLAFMSIKDNAMVPSDPSEKWGSLYALDKQIGQRRSVCRVAGVDAACSAARPSDKVNCENAVSQLKVEWQSAMYLCNKAGFSVHSCLEGGLEGYGPHYDTH